MDTGYALGLLLEGDLGFHRYVMEQHDQVVERDKDSLPYFRKPTRSMASKNQVSIAEPLQAPDHSRDHLKAILEHSDSPDSLGVASDVGEGSASDSSGTGLGSSSSDMSLFGDDEPDSRNVVRSLRDVKDKTKNTTGWSPFLSLFARLYEAHLFLG